MWKFVTRGIRESLERRANRHTNICSQNSQDSSGKGETKTSLVCNQKISFISDSAKCTAKDKKQESKWDAKHNWTEAVGWTGVLAVGWVVCQSLCLRRRFFDHEQREATFQKRVLQLPELHLRRLLSLRPQFIFPTVHGISNGAEKVDASTETDDWTPEGPLSAEEALKEAENKFAYAHKLAAGEYELRLGILAIKDKRYEDALKNFSTGATLFSPSSLFNLGLCHQMGYGTETNDIKAAKYYKKAAEMGHVGAMYNLAVFHAQGKGNLTVDIDKARTLFKRAAELGEEKAKEALKVDEQFQKEKEIELVKKKTSSMKKAITNTIISHLARYESSKKSESYFTDKKLNEDENSTEAFLNLLGLNESTTVAQPIVNSC